MKTETDSGASAGPPSGWGVRIHRSSRDHVKSPKRILVVDANRTVLKTIASKLQACGYEVLTAEDGGSAISQVRQLQPHLIVLELVFPPDVGHGGGIAWDGLLILSWARRTIGVQNIPAIVITGGDLEKYKDRWVEAGVLDIFRKPIDHEALLSAVRWALDQEVAQHDPTPTDPSGQPSAEKETAKASLADAGSASHATADETDAAPKGASALDGLRTGTTEELLSAVETAGGVTPEQTQAVPEPEVVLDEVVESAAESILIVEDEAAIADTLRSALEPLSFRVSGVTTGAEAVSLIAVGDVDLILFDLTLPDLRVEQFYEAVKGVKPELCSRIIFMTSDDSHPADDGFVRRLKGISLWKPFPTDWLLEAVQAIRAGSQQDRLAAK